jgi:hypothetical protein
MMQVLASPRGLFVSPLSLSVPLAVSVVVTILAFAKIAGYLPKERRHRRWELGTCGVSVLASVGILGVVFSGRVDDKYQYACHVLLLMSCGLLIVYEVCFGEKIESFNNIKQGKLILDLYSTANNKNYNIGGYILVLFGFIDLGRCIGSLWYGGFANSF